MPERARACTASFTARAMALAIDTILLAAIHVYILFVPAPWFIGETLYSTPLEILGLFTAYVFVFVASFPLLHMFYFTLFHAFAGQTVGKMILGIRVLSLDNGEVSVAAAFLRWTGYVLSLMPLAAGFLWSAVDKDHCAWHDRLARTRVIPTEMT